MHQRCLFLTVMGFILAAPVFADGATYYVAKTGNDNYSCAQAQSASTSKLTLAAGISCLAGGDTLIIKSGTYNETIQSPAVNIPSGSPVRPTTIKIGTSDTVTIKGSGQYILKIANSTDIVIDGLNRNLILSGPNTTQGVVIVQDSERITIQNAQLRDTINPAASATTCFTMHSQVKAASVAIKLINNEFANCGAVAGGKGHGIYLSYCRDCILEKNDIHDAAGHGIHNYNSGGYAINDNNIIRFNHIYNNQSRGILLGSGNDSIVHHNIVRGNGKGFSAGGITVGFAQPINMQVYNNTIYSNTGECITVRAEAFQTKLKNNLCLSNTTNKITASGTATVQRTNRISLDETLVVDTRAANFIPRQNSALIDAGEIIPAFSSGTFFGSAPDQGAVEFIPTQAPQIPPAPTSLQVVSTSE